MKLLGKVLITQGAMSDLAGSEVVTLELAEYFSRAGSEVIVYSKHFGDRVTETLETAERVKWTTEIKDVDLQNLDLLWVHHQFLPKPVLELALRGGWHTTTIFHHMSPFGLLEQPYTPRVELALSNLTLYNSEETREAIETSFFPDPAMRPASAVFGNPAPDSFWREPGSFRPRARLERLLVVSNHLPDEVGATLALLKRAGIKITVLGRQGKHYRRVRPRDIHESDAILTIGKTVQYGILGGTPVYCYDRFGGPGYLSPENIRRAEWFNFSGRGFSRKQASQIADELVVGYSGAASYGTLFALQYHSQFSLSAQCRRVLSIAAGNSAQPGAANPGDFGAALVLQDVLGQYDRSLRSIRSSTSWRVTEPLRSWARSFASLRREFERARHA